MSLMILLGFKVDLVIVYKHNDELIQVGMKYPNYQVYK